MNLERKQYMDIIKTFLLLFSIYFFCSVIFIYFLSSSPDYYEGLSIISSGKHPVFFFFSVVFLISSYSLLFYIGWITISKYRGSVFDLIFIGFSINIIKNSFSIISIFLIEIQNNYLLGLDYIDKYEETSSFLKLSTIFIGNPLPPLSLLIVFIVVIGGIFSMIFSYISRLNLVYFLSFRIQNIFSKFENKNIDEKLFVKEENSKKQNKNLVKEEYIKDLKKGLKSIKKTFGHLFVDILNIINNFFYIIGKSFIIFLKTVFFVVVNFFKYIFGNIKNSYSKK